MPKLLFIYNPTSGQGRVAQYLSKIVDVFVKKGFSVEIYPSQSERDAFLKAGECADKFDRLVVAGGDGTLSEVVSGIIGAGKRVPIGYIPMGSTNDFAGSLGLPQDCIEAAKLSAGDRSRFFDAGKFGKNYFIYVAAFGLFTEASYSTSQDLKNAIGHFAYILEGAKELMNIPTYHVELVLDGKRTEGDYLFGMVTNSTQIGGVSGFVGQDVELDDGYLEVTMVSPPRNPMEFTELLAYFANMNRDASRVLYEKAKHIEVHFSEEVSWTLDGEFGGAHRDIEIDALPKAMEVLI